MRSSKNIVTIVTFVLLTGTACKAPKPTPPYAIRDYPDTLQPWLNRAVNFCILDYDNAAIRYLSTQTTDTHIQRSRIHAAAAAIP